MLSAIAGSMITVAGVVFSITIVALSLASSQYSSRVLRHFMRDRITQTVLGVFVGVFDYCMAILARLARRRLGPPCHYYAEGTLRVITCGPTFVALLARAFDSICWYAAGNVTVLAHLLRALETLAQLTESLTRRQALRQQAQQLYGVIRQSVVWPGERQALTSRCVGVSQLLDRSFQPSTSGRPRKR
jgi:uncharacterized membrane protein